jgi:hypothetical protein
MIDEDKGHQGIQGSDGDGYLYDYFKYLTSLALLTLGGVLTLSEKMEDTFSRYALTAVLVLVTLSGALSFSAVGEIVRGKHTGTSYKNIEAMRRVAPALLALGIGVFVYLFHKKLGISTSKAG